MKKSLFVLVAIFSFTVLFTACKGTKKEEVKEEVNVENHDNHGHSKGEMASNFYQCPMDCEKGKTYEAVGSCPVCEMDLKAIASETEHVEGCKYIGAGECKWEPGKCTCKAEVVSSVKEFSKCEPGNFPAKHNFYKLFESKKTRLMKIKRVFI